MVAKTSTIRQMEAESLVEFIPLCGYHKEDFSITNFDFNGRYQEVINISLIDKIKLEVPGHDHILLVHYALEVTQVGVTLENLRP